MTDGATEGPRYAHSERATRAALIRADDVLVSAPAEEA
jgi:hypothetical protein